MSEPCSLTAAEVKVVTLSRFDHYQLDSSAPFSSQEEAEAYREQLPDDRDVFYVVELA